MGSGRETIVHGMAQQCAACGHRHQQWQDIRRLPVCGVCGCAEFRARDDDQAADDAAEAADRAAFAGRQRLLSGYGAQSIKQVVTGLEQELFGRAGWRLPPMFGVLHAGVAPGAVRDAYGQRCAAIIADPLDMPKDLYAAAGGDPARMIVAAAALGEQKPSWFDRFRVTSGLDPADRVVAWWSITSLDVVDQCTGEVKAGVRELLCVDVDERVYTVVRQRPVPGGGPPPTRPVTASLDVLDGYRVKAQPLLDRGAMRPGPTTGLPMMVEGLLRCVRLCRDEAQVRSILEQAAQEPPPPQG